MSINPNLKTLMQADFNKVYVYKKDEQGNLGTCSKSFLGRLWLCLSGNTANAKSEKVADAINDLITSNNLLNLSPQNKNTLGEKLTELNKHFSHIVGGRGFGIVSTIDSVIARILPKPTSSSTTHYEARQVVPGGRRPSLSDLYPSTGVVPVKPQPPAPATPLKGSVVAPGASRVLKDAYDPRAALVAAISNQETTQEVTESRSSIVAVKDGRDVLQVPRFELKQGRQTITTNTFTDVGYHIRNPKLKHVDNRK